MRRIRCQTGSIPLTHPATKTPSMIVAPHAVVPVASAVPDFSDTIVAFDGRSDAELRRAAMLFRTIAHPTLVACGTRAVRVALRLGLPIEWLLRRTIFPHFVGGTSLETCRPTLDRLAHRRAGAILDYAVESAHDEAGFDQVTDELVRATRFAAAHRAIPFAVFKMTAVAREGLLEAAGRGPLGTAALRSEYDRVRARVDRITGEADRAGIPIMIDAERVRHQDAIDTIALEAMRRFNRERTLVLTTVQLYRRDGLAKVESLLEQGRTEGFLPGFKLVRGAYLDEERRLARESGVPDPIQPDKAATDRDFDAAVARCMHAIDRCALCLGSHNEASCRQLAQAMIDRGIDRAHPRIWFSQLLGMSDHLTFALAEAGFNAAKYVPYGPVRQVIPYLIRRAEENMSITGGQTGREIDLLERELARRRRSARGPGAG